MNKRLKPVDALKGFAILLVVVGHSLQANVVDYDNNLIFRIIYSFHMPMFMFLSGMISRYSSEDSWINYLKKKFLALVVPFVAWYVVGYWLNHNYQNVEPFIYIWRLIVSPDWGLWFLWILFLNHCFFVLNIKIEKGLGLFSFIFTYYFIRWIPSDILGLGMLKIYYPFFILGYLIMKYKESLLEHWKRYKYFSLIIFPVLVTHWYRILGFDFSDNIRNYFVNFKVGFLSEYVMLFLNLVLVLSGIGFSYLLISLFRKTILNKLLIYLGTYTMDIYITNNIFSNLGVGGGSVKVFSSITIAIALSLLLSLSLFRRIKLLNIILLGGRKIEYGNN